MIFRRVPDLEVTGTEVLCGTASGVMSTVGMHNRGLSSARPVRCKNVRVEDLPPLCDDEAFGRVRGPFLLLHGHNTGGHENLVAVFSGTLSA